MQRPPRLDSFSRIPPSPTSLPTPPESSMKSQFERSGTMSPVSTRYNAAPGYRRASRASFGTTTSADDAKSFVLESDACPNKYMHRFDGLTDHHELPRPNKAEHQVKQDPSGTLKTWEYQLPEHLWPPVKENAKTLDGSLKIRWGRENGYVQITNIGKALLIPNLKMSEFLKGYDDQIVRIRGGQIEVQGSWIPYDLARKVCLEKCYKIRHYLAPLFGPDFVDGCIQIEESDEKQMKGRPGRKPRSPSFSLKRAAEEDETDPTTYDRIPRKRRTGKHCASGAVTPPPLPSNLNLDAFGSLSLDEICSMLSAARELTRLQHCALDDTPVNDWPMPGDPKMGGLVNYRGHSLYWDGGERLREKPSTPKIPLPSVKEMVQSAPTTSYGRFPITPPLRESPFPVHPYDWHNVAPQPLISPPMSLRDSFSGRDRHNSVVNTDECRTPVQESYVGSLFPTPQPEGRYEGRFEEGC